MKIPVLTLILAISHSAGMLSQGATLAYWHFNTLSISAEDYPGSSDAPMTIDADSGSGTISFAGWGGTLNALEGSLINAIGLDEAGNSLTYAAGSPNPWPGNNTYFEIVGLDFSGEVNMALTYATRGVGKGFDIGTWSYSIGGSPFTDVPGNYSNKATTYDLMTVDMSGISELDGAVDVTLRFTTSGATSNASPHRIDNLQVISGFDPVPEPSTSLLGLLAGLCLIRRRR